jgi:DNA-binding GntR family transcriptional regulator
LICTKKIRLDYQNKMSYYVFMPSSNQKLRPLRPGASTPLWLQLKHALRDYITFELKPGDRIPSEVGLCTHYGLSRITVRRAIAALLDEGLLIRQQGRGTFILSPRLAEPVSDPDHFLRSGFDRDPASISVYSAETVPAADWIASKLGLSPGEEVHKIRKILTKDGAPVAFRTTFVPRRLAPSLLGADITPPLYVLFEGLYRLRPTEADEVFEFIVADEFRAGILGVTVGHPLILAERLVYLDSGEPIDYSRAYYRADRFRFHRRIRCTEGKSVADQAPQKASQPIDD